MILWQNTEVMCVKRVKPNDKIIMGLWEVFSIYIDYKAEELEFALDNFISTEINGYDNHNIISMVYQDIRLRIARRKTNIGLITSQEFLKSNYIFCDYLCYKRQWRKG